MRRLYFYITFISLLFFSCKESGAVHKPNDLIPPQQMSEIIAQFAISDQATFQNSGGNLEISTRYILNEHKVSAKSFEQSYNYYIASPRLMENILRSAQEIIMEKDPGAKGHIEKKLKEIGQTPYYSK